MYFYLFLVLASVFNPVAGQGAALGEFSNPPPVGVNTDYSANPVWKVGTTQTIRWTSTVQVYNISIWQQNLQIREATHIATIFAQLDTGTQVSSFDWVVQDFNADVKKSNVFYLGVNDFTADIYFTSHYYNTTSSTASTTTSSASTSTTATTTITNPASLVPVNTPSTIPEPSTNPSIKFIAGLSLGLGIPVLVLLGLLIYVTLIKRRKAEAPSVAPIYPGTELSGEKVLGSGRRAELEHPTAEMQAGEQRVELAGQGAHGWQGDRGMRYR